MSSSPYKYNNTEKGCAYSYIAPIVLRIIGSQKLRILELGCGNGYFSNALTNAGHEVTALDDSETGINIGRSNFPQVRFIKANIYSLFGNTELASGYFDAVISLEVIEHLQYPRELLKVAKNYLKEGGQFIISTPYHGYFKNLALSLFNKWDNHFSVSWDVGHLRFFSSKTLKKMLEQEGFFNIRFKYSGRFFGVWKDMICFCEAKK